MKNFNSLKEPFMKKNMCLGKFVALSIFSLLLSVPLASHAGQIEKISACKYAATKVWNNMATDLLPDVFRDCIKSNADAQRVLFCKSIATKTWNNMATDLLPDVFRDCINSNASEELLIACKNASTKTWNNMAPDLLPDVFHDCIK